jgi:hypothetical protein
VSNHAHRRGRPIVADDPYRHGVFAGFLQFVKECFSPAEGRDRYPRRATATGRMKRAIRRGYFGRRML